MKEDRGFSLLEVLVAMTILSFASLAMAKLQVGTLQANAFAKRRTIALNFAQDRVEKVRAGLACSNAQITYGSLAFALTCQSVNGPNNTKDVTVTVRWSDPTQQSVQIRTLI
jgi:type IV pilus modification protein PilV